MHDHHLSTPARARFARGRPPDKPIPAGPPDTPAIDRQCLFPSKYHDASNEAGPEDITFEELQQALKTMAGTIVTPVDALMRFHHYTAHFPDDYDIDRVTVTALLTLSGASATDIRNFLTRLADDPSGLLTPSAPSPAGCKSGGLGAQDATAYDRGTECLQFEKAQEMAIDFTQPHAHYCVDRSASPGSA